MDFSANGLSALWAQADSIGRGVGLLLALMSTLVWGVIAVKLVQLWRLRRPARSAADAFWGAASFDAGLASLGTDNPFRTLAEAAHAGADWQRHQHGALGSHIPPRDWTERSLAQAVAHAQSSLGSGMAGLAAIASTAPFVGLFGTVWGIQHALVAIGTSGQAGLDRVAGPVGEALVMTAAGLAVAVPAALAYNLLVRANRETLARLNRFGYDLLAYFDGGERVGRRPQRAPEA